MHKHLTLERILGDEPVPEYRCCTRCGNDMPVKREGEQCSDCDGALKFHPRGTQGQRLPQYHPAYEVSVHYAKQPKECPTIRTLEALNIPYIIYLAKRDPIEVDWATKLPYLGNREDWPIVTISAYGQYVEHWTGFQLTKLNRIPAARAAAIHTEPSEAAVARVPVEQEQAA